MASYMYDQLVTARGAKRLLPDLAGLVEQANGEGEQSRRRAALQGISPLPISTLSPATASPLRDVLLAATLAPLVDAFDRIQDPPFVAVGRSDAAA